MSERKVLNKYFPPNFDPSRIPKNIIPRDKQHTVRLMTPFSMRCNTCGEYIYKGRKFNARKETVEGEMYLTIKIFRFYIRCPVCGAEITFKTDPKNADYVAEHGAKRNFEPWRDELKEGEEAKNRRLMEELYNPMKALENKTFDSKREIEILEGLDEIRMGNALLEGVDTDAVFVRVATRQDEDVLRRALEEEAEDEEAVKAAFAHKRMVPVEYEDWSDEGGEAEIVGEAPLMDGESMVKDLGLDGGELPIVVVAPTKTADVVESASLSKKKKQALLGIAPKKPKS